MISSLLPGEDLLDVIDMRTDEDSNSLSMDSTVGNEGAFMFSLIGREY